MDIPKTLLDVLKHEGVVTIVTQSNNEPHIANTWNSYITITNDGNFLVPAGGMKQTEQNLKILPKLIMSIGSREVKGFHSMGTGFVIEANGEFMYNGYHYDIMKTKFSWCRAVLLIKPIKITQTL